MMRDGTIPICLHIERKDRTMLDKDRVNIVSGESGAGKTHELLASDGTMQYEAVVFFDMFHNGTVPTLLRERDPVKLDALFRSDEQSFNIESEFMNDYE